MNDNYYNEIIKEIMMLLKNNNIEDAYWRLREELEMPYIPREIESKLISIFKEVNAKRNELKSKNPQQNWTLDEINEMLCDPFDEEIHLVAFEYLKTMNVRPILSTLKNYLLNSLYRNESKTFLLYLLKEQNVDEVLTVKKTNGVFNINPTQLIDFNANKNVQLIVQLLEEYIYNNNPSLYAICFMVLQNYYYAMLPQFIDGNNIKPLVAAIIYKGYELQGNTVPLVKICNLVECDSELAQPYLTAMLEHQIV